MTSHVAIIVATGLNSEIGLSNDIPWRIPGEQKRFKSLTMSKFVAMGRRTYESIPGGLPGRHVLVLSRTTTMHLANNARRVESVDQALSCVPTGETLYVAGGSQVYAAFLPKCNLVYLTQIYANFDADTFFPRLDTSEFELIESERVDTVPPYSYQTWRRKATNDR